MDNACALVGIRGSAVWVRKGACVAVLVMTLVLVPSCATGTGAGKADVASLIEALRQDYDYPAGFHIPDGELTPAMAALADAGPQVVPALIKELWHPKDVVYWSAVVITLGAIQDQRAVDPIVESWRSLVARETPYAQRPQFSYRLSEALAQIGGLRAAEALAALYDEFSVPAHSSVEFEARAYIRYEIVKALVRVGGKAAVPPLLDAVTVLDADEFHPTRELALRTLNRWLDVDANGDDPLSLWLTWEATKLTLVFYPSEGRFRVRLHWKE